jgi:hypothetical protein
MQLRACIVVLLGAFSVGGGAAHAKVIEDVPGSLKGLQTIWDALQSADQRPVHILYMHGINSLGADDSQVFRDSICKREHLCASAWQSAGTEYPDYGAFDPKADPPALQYLGAPIWSKSDSAKEWRASAPFVTHYVVQLRGHNGILVVDEINWWPLVLKLKCQRIVPGDTRLTGPNESLLQFCSRPIPPDQTDAIRYTQYPWITKDEADQLMALPKRSALINRAIKAGLEDWGFSDVLLGVGPLRPVMEEGIRQLIAKSAAFDPRAGSGTTTVGQGRAAYDWQGHLTKGDNDQVFIAVTHSMGSFLLLDTLKLDTGRKGVIAPFEIESREGTAEDQALKYVAERTSLIYFFANQVPILELANLTTGPNIEAAAPGAAGNAGAQSAQAAAPAQVGDSSESILISQWAQLHAAFEQKQHPNDSAAQLKIQLVAFSDPSDLLTWRVPKLRDVAVVNLYVQNAHHVLWLIESPTNAHDNYAKDKDVIKVMFGKH